MSSRIGFQQFRQLRWASLRNVVILLSRGFCMRNEFQSLNRRGFLLFAGTAAGALSTLFRSRLFAQARRNPTHRPAAPKNPVILRSPSSRSLSIAKTAFPSPTGSPPMGPSSTAKNSASNSARSSAGNPPGNSLFYPSKQPTPPQPKAQPPSPSRPSPEKTRTTSFTLRYELRDANLIITLEDITEAEGYELISVEIPRLVTVHEANPTHGLPMATLAAASSPSTKQSPAPFRPISSGALLSEPFPSSCSAPTPSMCVQETTAYMDGGFLSVIGPNGSRRAAIGSSKVHRVNGGACYDLNLPKDQPRNCGTATTPNLLVEQKSSCRLDFLPVTDSAAALASRERNSSATACPKSRPLSTTTSTPTASAATSLSFPNPPPPSTTAKNSSATSTTSPTEHHRSSISGAGSSKAKTPATPPSTSLTSASAAMTA